MPAGFSCGLFFIPVFPCISNADGNQQTGGVVWQAAAIKKDKKEDNNKMDGKKLLSYDDSVLTLETRDELHNYTSFREQNDIWVDCFLNEVGVIGIPDEPLFFPERLKGIRLKRNGYTVEAGDIDPDCPENMECIKGTGIFLAFPYRDRMRVVPTGPTAYQSICRRAGDTGPVMCRWTPSNQKKVLPVKEKAERLNRDLMLYTGMCKILVRDGKARAVLSPEYCPLPAGGLVGILEKWMGENFPAMELDHATATHEFLIAEYYLNDRDTETRLRHRLNMGGADIVSLRTGLRLVTSDVGLANAAVSLFYDADGARVTIGGHVELEHKGEASLRAFQEQLGKIPSMFRDCNSRLEWLQGKAVPDVPAAFQAARERLGFLPKLAADEVAEGLANDFPGGGNAMDVYLAVCEVFKRYMEKTVVTQAKYRQICSQMEQVISMPFVFE